MTETETRYRKVGGEELARILERARIISVKENADRCTSTIYVVSSYDNGESIEFVNHVPLRFDPMSTFSVWALREMLERAFVERALFIGGEFDGDRMEFDPEKYGPVVVNRGDNHYSYRKVYFSIGKLTIPVFVAGMITDEMALKMLIDGYGVSDGS